MTPAPLLLLRAWAIWNGMALVLFLQRSAANDYAPSRRDDAAMDDCGAAWAGTARANDALGADDRGGFCVAEGNEASKEAKRDQRSDQSFLHGQAFRCRWIGLRNQPGGHATRAR
jgi:hypothetical protein